MTAEGRRKKAILFGGTDGHGITMTAISERALKCQGYDVETICHFHKGELSVPLTIPPTECGTGSTEFFWAFTFPHWDYSSLEAGDIVIVVDLPLPIQDQILDFSAADTGIKKIVDLCSEKKIRVILIDHHKHALTHYGKAIEGGAELLFSLGPVRYSHYGLPDDYTLFWGSIGAICDRDSTMLPVEKEEEVLFSELEHRALWLDAAKKNINDLDEPEKDPLVMIRNDNRNIPSQVKFGPMPEFFIIRQVAYIPELGRGGFKKLDAACRRTGTPYGVGLGKDKSGKYLLAINYWKMNSTPVALKLHAWRKLPGHDSAIKFAIPDSEDAEKTAKKVIGILNSGKIEGSDTLKTNPDVIDYLVSANEKSRSDIPTWLTIHGWPHIETVFANAQLLGTLMNCPSDDQVLLNWSALFHDLGNGAKQYEKECQLNKDYIKDNKDVRKYHHQLTVDILTSWRKRGFCKTNDAGKEIITDNDFLTICEMCFRHRKNSKKHPDPRIEKLCSLLRIADALDKTKSRARTNDNGEPSSKVLKDLAFKNTPDSWESVKNWEGQLAIETIRLYISQKNKQNHITFEFLVTDRQKAAFIIEDFKKELETLDRNIATWDVRTIVIPLFN